MGNKENHGYERNGHSGPRGCGPEVLLLMKHHTKDSGVHRPAQGNGVFYEKVSFFEVALSNVRTYRSIGGSVFTPEFLTMPMSMETLQSSF